MLCCFFLKTCFSLVLLNFASTCSHSSVEIIIIELSVTDEICKLNGNPVNNFDDNKNLVLIFF